MSGADGADGENLLASLGLRRGEAAVALAIAVLSAFTVVPAAAEIEGNCSATINGTDVKSLSSASAAQAVEVEPDSQVTVTMQSSGAISDLKIFLELISGTGARFE